MNKPDVYFIKYLYSNTLLLGFDLILVFVCVTKYREYRWFKNLLLSHFSFIDAVKNSELQYGNLYSQMTLSSQSCMIFWAPAKSKHHSRWVSEPVFASGW